MAGLIDSFVQGYMSRMGGGRGNSGQLEAQQAQQTASAYQQLQDVMKQDYDMQKAEAQKQGKDWSMPSPTERMNDQIQAMILSGDANLQNRGLAMMDVPKDDEQTTLQKTAKALGWTPQQVFDKMHPGAASTRINVNLPKQDQPMTFEDAQKLDWSGVPGGYQPGMSMMDAGKAGARLASTKDQAESGATAGSTKTSLTEMEQTPGTTQGAIPGTIADIRSRPDMLGQVLNTTLNAAGRPQRQPDVQFNARKAQVAGNITRLMSGAAASDQDVARVANMLPNLGDDAKTRETKFKVAQDQADIYVKSAKNKGGNNVDGSTTPKAAAPTKRYNPATGKIEAIK